jgi:AcrR family transcriptional regulator
VAKDQDLPTSETVDSFTIFGRASAARYPGGVTGSAAAGIAARSRSTALIRHGEARVAETERKVLLAAMELVAGEGPAAITIERVASRSGVARSTIYRHWHHVDDLVVDACRALTRPQPVALNGEPFADLRALAVDDARELDDPAFFAVLVFLMDASRRSRALFQLGRSLQRERQRRIAGVVRTAVGRG